MVSRREIGTPIQRDWQVMIFSDQSIICSSILNQWSILPTSAGSASSAVAKPKSAVSSGFCSVLLPNLSRTAAASLTSHTWKHGTLVIWTILQGRGMREHKKCFTSESFYTGFRLWSAKSASSMKADQIPKIGLLMVFFLLKSLLFWISHKITMKKP